MKMSADEKHLLLTLYNGKSYIELQKQKNESRHVKSYPFRRDQFEHQEMIIEMTGFGLNRTDETLFRNSYSMMNLTQLNHFDDSLTIDLDDNPGQIPACHRKDPDRKTKKYPDQTTGHGSRLPED